MGTCTPIRLFAFGPVYVWIALSAIHVVDLRADDKHFTKMLFGLSLLLCLAVGWADTKGSVFMHTIDHTSCVSGERMSDSGCVPCVAGRYMPWHRHRSRKCYNCSKNKWSSRGARKCSRVALWSMRGKDRRVHNFVQMGAWDTMSTRAAPTTSTRISTTTHTPATRRHGIPETPALVERCVNWPTGWHDARWESCEHYERSALEGCGPYALAHAREDGISADDACCICGGGRQRRGASAISSAHLLPVHAHAAVASAVAAASTATDTSTAAAHDKDKLSGMHNKLTETESTALQQFLGSFVEKPSSLLVR